MVDLGASCVCKCCGESSVQNKVGHFYMCTDRNEVVGRKVVPRVQCRVLFDSAVRATRSTRSSTELGLRRRCIQVENANALDIYFMAAAAADPSVLSAIPACKLNNCQPSRNAEMSHIFSKDRSLKQKSNNNETTTTLRLRWFCFSLWHCFSSFAIIPNLTTKKGTTHSSSSSSLLINT